MMNKNFTLTDKIKTVDVLVDDFRWARGKEDEPEHLTYWTLKAIADDLRARQRHVRLDALDDLQRAVDMANANKVRNYYEPGRLQFLAERLIGRWPVVRQALERFAADAEVAG